MSPQIPASNSSEENTIHYPRMVKSHQHANTSIIMVAIYEIAKGIAALAVAAVVYAWHDKLLWMMHLITKDLHLLLGHLFIRQLEAMNHYALIANQNWLKAFWFVIGYALLRFIEAYGLYRDKTWAYWYSVLGYGIFLPLELYELLTKPFDWFNLLILLLNVVIVIVVYRNMQKKGLLGRKTP